MNAHLPGQHGILDAYDCDVAILCDALALEHAMRQAADAVGARILSAHLHAFGAGQGVTGVLLLAESHLSIHTWPECGFAALDIFLCGNLQPEQARKLLQQALGAQRCEWQILPRGNKMAT